MSKIVLVLLLTTGCYKVVATKKPPVTPTKPIQCLSATYRGEFVYFCGQSFYVCEKVRRLGEQYGNKAAVNNVSDCAKMKLSVDK